MLGDVLGYFLLMLVVTYRKLTDCGELANSLMVYFPNGLCYFCLNKFRCLSTPIINCPT